MSKTPEKYFEEFQAFIRLVARVHNAGRSHFPPGTTEGHHINENTLVRIDSQLEGVRTDLGEPNWFDPSIPTFCAYITMREYRNAIIHNSALMTDVFEAGRKLNKFRRDYDWVCYSIGVKPLNPGEPLVLSVREPDVLLRLIMGVEWFAESVLTGKIIDPPSAVFPAPPWATKPNGPPS